MDLWIRSQDRKVLAKVNDIAINDTEIIGYFDKETEFENLGNYKTEERALEVLDEIQERIINLQLVNLEEKGKARSDVYNKEYLRCVYEMPKE